VLSLGEIHRGAERLLPRDPIRASSYLTWLATLESRYAGRLLPVTLEIAHRWGGLSVNQPLPSVDGLIAATALVHNLTVVTRNTADFARAGVSVLNPFTP